MKINVSFDLTPEEFRRVMGLPDVQQFQQEVFSQMMEKMKSGEEGYDAMSLYKPLFSESMNAMTQFQQLMFGMMAGKSEENSNE
ncbi:MULTISPECIES: DUF6489 family protein [Oceanospirillaceae]|jgi:hypothetical protein|uniref:DUF6489 family protein n=1 Tax=Oceanobacter antarcticus TaxID=3133425 RepID=A0ABW8NKG7_9GAMM|tara:strand:+ start:16425 stop:16676 length:252 start_codon:yes stop_codon:yes gene_type:complete